MNDVFRYRVIAGRDRRGCICRITIRSDTDSDTIRTRRRIGKIAADKLNRVAGNNSARVGLHKIPVLLIPFAPNPPACPMILSVTIGAILLSVVTPLVTMP